MRLRLIVSICAAACVVISTVGWRIQLLEFQFWSIYVFVSALYALYLMYTLRKRRRSGLAAHDVGGLYSSLFSAVGVYSVAFISPWMSRETPLSWRILTELAPGDTAQSSILRGVLSFVAVAIVFTIILHLIREPHCLLYTSPSPRDATLSRMPSSA